MVEQDRCLSGLSMLVCATKRGRILLFQGVRRLSANKRCMNWIILTGRSMIKTGQRGCAVRFDDGSEAHDITRRFVRQLGAA